jgi:beta-N-acetylhexosaminidase
MPAATYTPSKPGLRARRICLSLLVLIGLLVAVTTSACAGDEGTSSSADRPATTGAAGSTTVGAPPTSVTTLPEPTTSTAPDPIEALVAGMDLRAKVGQLFMLGFPGTTASPELEALLRGGGIGGVILLGRNITGPEQLTRLTSDLQGSALADGSGIALLVAVDQEGGTVRRVREGVTQAPGARSVAESMTADEAQALARQVAEGLFDLGVNTNLAPVADVIAEPGAFLYNRTYGGDPTIVSKYVRAVVRGQEQAGVISVVKHFPGHGSAAGNTHEGLVTSNADLDEMASRHLVPFEAAVEVGAPMIMTSHVVAAGLGDSLPASLSPIVLEGLLRERLGFEGVVITDDLRMAGASGSEMAAVDAVRAGADMVLILGGATEQQSALGLLVAAAESGELSLQRLDEAVQRVLRLKSRYGLLSTAS